MLGSAASSQLGSAAELMALAALGAIDVMAAVTVGCVVSEGRGGRDAGGGDVVTSSHQLAALGVFGESNGRPPGHWVIFGLQSTLLS